MKLEKDNNMDYIDVKIERVVDNLEKMKNCYIEQKDLLSTPVSDTEEEEHIEPTIVETTVISPSDS